MPDEVNQPTFFGFRPWPPGDPIAPWPWLVEQLGESQRVSLARVALQMNKAILQAQVAAYDQAIGLLSKQP